MTVLTGYRDFAEAQQHYSKAALWKLFDGEKPDFNIAHECIDRYAADADRVAVSVFHVGGKREHLTFAHIARRSAQVAHWLVAQGIKPGDRVAFMLEPSEAFYISLFGALRSGAIGVPLFTLFGPEGLRLRVNDCAPSILITNGEKANAALGIDNLQVIVADDAWMKELDAYPASFTSKTGAGDLAIFQYTSGTTRELPAAVKHTHGAIVVLMGAALYGTGIRPGDRFFCPSSPAWGHGLWHGTLAPLALGVTTGTLSGKFDATKLIDALEEFRITNMSAAATHYRMMKLAGTATGRDFAIEKLSYTGEPIDNATLQFIDETFDIPVCSMYGTTEIGVVLVNYPGASDYVVKPGSLGRPIPGVQLEVRDADGKRAASGQIGELFLERRGEWLSTKDLAKTDDDGYFYHAGRADDVIISAGWTMSAVEIENVLLRHPDVKETAAIGVDDSIRGKIVKAFIVTERPGTPDFAVELQNFTRQHLSQHEYPRVVSFVSELPKTPAGKVNRKILRDREALQTTVA